MRLINSVRVALVVAMSAVPAMSAAQELTKIDRQGPVTVTVKLSARPVVGLPFKARVILDTHSVSLDGVAFETAVTLRGPDGGEVAPMAVEQAKGSGHHREADLVFGAVPGSGTTTIVVKNVGGVPERIFTWEWP